MTRVPPKKHVSRDANSVDLPQPHNKIGDGPWKGSHKSNKGKGKKGKNKGKEKVRSRTESEPPEAEADENSKVPPWCSENKAPPWRRGRQYTKEANTSSRTPDDDDWGEWTAPKSSTASSSTAPPQAKSASGVDTDPARIITSGSSLNARMRRTNPFEFLEIDVETVAQGLALSKGDIKAAWRKMLLKLHPDKAGDSQEAQDKMVMLNLIYEHLNQPYMLEANAHHWLKPNVKEPEAPSAPPVEGALAQVLSKRVAVSVASGREFDPLTRRYAAAMAEQAAEVKAEQCAPKGVPVSFGPKTSADQCDACRKSLPQKDNKTHKGV